MQIDFLTQFNDTVWATLGFLLSFWWIVALIILFLVAFELFKDYTKAHYLTTLNWVMLEVRFSEDVHKSPKAMEQVFAALHSIPGGVRKKWVEGFWKGKIGDWFSLEIASISGEIHFFIRTLEAHRNLVQTQIYAHYPESEIHEVADYMDSFPAILPNETVDVSAAEFVLEKEDAYPIRTYPDFEEEKPGKDDAKRIDPLASLTEGMSLLTVGECLALQIIIRPKKGEDWVKESQKTIDKLMGKKEEPSKDALSKALGVFDSLLGVAAGEEKKAEEFSVFKLTPGKTEVIKAIERNITKLGFQTMIRMAYISPRETFNKSRSGIIGGAFKQFGSLNLNGFKKVSPDFDWVFKESRENKHKAKVYGRFRNREFLDKNYILNTEELATVYHFPDVSVKTTVLPRIEAKKGEAPAGLPI